jgi:outer membrane protein assembly factor BamD
MKRCVASLMIVFVLLMVFPSCKKKAVELTPDQTASDETLYKLGEQLIKKDPERARLYLRQVIDSFPKSFYAQRAKLAIANSYFDKGDESSMILAAAEYREFISLFPYSPSASFAQLRIALTFFHKILSPGRDQTKTVQALSEFKKVVSQYPLSEEAKQAQERIKDCEEKLAEHTFNIASLYYRNMAFKASSSRLVEILTNYPNYSKLDQVYYTLADSYFLWKKTDESLPFFSKLVTDYPQSPWAQKAQKRLKEIETLKAEPPAKK